jgi:benzoyl-CoA reductase/2-hydroxyglutaryl-CoA dehydratase subunit BcrC/BadD/HgdB
VGKILNIAGDELHKPDPISLEDRLEAARLEAARRQVEARPSAVKENTAFLEQALQEIKRRTA